MAMSMYKLTVLKHTSNVNYKKCKSAAALNYNKCKHGNYNVYMQDPTMWIVGGHHEAKEGYMKAGYAGYESPIYEGYEGYESPEGGKGVDVSVGLLCHDKTNSNTQFNPVSTREVVCIPCYSSCRVLVAFHSI